MIVMNYHKFFCEDPCRHEAETHENGFKQPWKLSQHKNKDNILFCLYSVNFGDALDVYYLSVTSTEQLFSKYNTSFGVSKIDDQYSIF